MPRSGNQLGRTLTKARDRQREVSSRHTTDFGSANTAVSITENTSLDEFLSNAEAAQRSFEAERATVQIVRHEGPMDKLDDLAEENEEEEEEDEGPFCSVPKRPNWREMSAEEFTQAEVDMFLKWRKRLNRLQENNKNLPPFEKNLEFWRQFWRIIELSDVVIQVVDARDPLFYHNQDLTDYVSEISLSKEVVILMNKADFLSREQRVAWAEYFKESDLRCMFFSAAGDEDEDSNLSDDEQQFNTSRIFTPTQILQTLQNFVPRVPLSVGFLGYPNVGKSSTINRFLTNKRLQVSATPGKTKHYQTHELKGEVKLVDGPGLVMPNLRMTKADMVLAGILPIDNLTDFMPSMDLLLTKVPYSSLLNHYNVMASCVKQARKVDRKSESMQVLSALAIMRGFFKPGGVPDQFRAARVVLKDYVQGKLLFCKGPPGCEQKEYHAYADADEVIGEEEDEEEVPITNSGIHARGTQAQFMTGKGKGKNKAPKKKKEKVRRLYKDKDPYM